MTRADLELALVESFREEVDSARPSRSLVGDVLARLGEREKPSWWRRLVPRTRLAWALAPLAVLLLVAGVAYASSSVIRERFASLFPQVEQSGLAQVLNLSQTVDGVTVRIERAYADSNAAMVGYTISGPPTTATGPGARYFGKSGGLVVEGGPVLPVLFESGTVPGSKDVLGDWNPADRLAVVAVFDTSAIQGTPSELSVKLTVRVFDSVPIPDTQPVQRTYTFDFKVKFHPAKVVTIDQTVHASVVPVSVDQAVIGLWATRIRFHFDPPFDGPYWPAPLVSLTTPDGTVTECAMSNASDMYFFGDFTSQEGEWTFNIDEMVIRGDLPPGVEVPESAYQNGQIRLHGPWPLHFTVP